MMKIHILSIYVMLMILQPGFSALKCPILYHGIKDHSACIPNSPKYISGGVSKADIKVIVDDHNKYRAAVNPPACSMLKLYWDEDLAYVAQNYAQNCDFNHDPNLKRTIPGKFGAGQNLAMGYSTWASAIKGWQSEVKDFTYASPSNDLHKVGHYTQMVWATTTAIGCGYATCTSMKLYVCNYGPAGNVGGISKPYEKCPKNPPLHDCKGKICKNFGEMETTSCNCKCKPFKHIKGPECDMVCSGNDTFPCYGPWKPAQCPISNVPPQCPWMCNFCPYVADYEKTKTTLAPSGATKGSGGGSNSDSNENSGSPKTDKIMYSTILATMMIAKLTSVLFFPGDFWIH